MNRRKKKDEEVEPRKPAYFWWFLANVLAACFAIMSWAFCLHVFGNPEIPRNYEVLKKIGRLPELKRYTVLDVPNGSALEPGELYGKYFQVEGEKRVRLNALLMRNYMRNFERSLLLSYVEGEYQVVGSRKLEKGDFIFPGFAIRAQAMVKQDAFTEAIGFPVVIEYLFPTDEMNAVDQFEAGDILEVNKNPNCAAVVHVSRAVVGSEPALQITAIPIAYGSYRIGDERAFSIEPPDQLNPAGSLPIWK
ncbi:MAG: hypothetical protein AB8D78_13935 [Akkermansiaceae bacterium]